MYGNWLEYLTLKFHPMFRSNIERDPNFKVAYIKIIAKRNHTNQLLNIFWDQW